MTPHRSQTAPEPFDTGAIPRQLIIVSNRLPVSLELGEDSWSFRPSSGGLVSAVGGLRKGEGFCWVGWPGAAVPADLQPEVTEALAAEQLVPVFLSPAEEAGYYNDYCNDVLWPLFHYFMDRVRPSTDAWATYEASNRKFTDAILAQCRPGDRVWIHDFHLLLVPAMLRAAMPDLEIGFFLHIPWPSSEVFRLLPNREEVLRGVLGSDYIAFHTNDYVHHFRTSCLRVLGLDSDPDRINVGDRRIGIGRHPIGIDTGYFRGVGQRDETLAIARDLRKQFQGRRVILGVERLDYSKGILKKLAAFERFLHRNPGRAEDVTLLQVIVPSRLASTEYQELKGAIEAEIGRINGCYARPGYTPIEYIHRSLPPAELVALYQFADVALVTPIRDGMNLVAQEFVLCQDHGTGMLILSEFAGAAQVLGESILVNPWHIDATAQAIATALEMSPRERQARMRPMLERVEQMDCKAWAHQFLRDMGRAALQTRTLRDRTSMDEAEVERLAARFAAAPRRVVLLDYDGTLRELAPTPEMASPTREIDELLSALTRLPETEVHIVSGRPSAALEEWFGHLPVHLSAEHGSLQRHPHGAWEPLQSYDTSWMDKVRELLEEVCLEVPGTQVENKQFSLAWHYRLADVDYGLWRARELLNSLESEVANLGVDVISGHKVIEVRASGANKGIYAHRILKDQPPGTMVLCIGDDRTDVDMYRALPPGATVVHVGGSVDDAGFTIESPERVRWLLRQLVEAFDRVEEPQATLVPGPPA